MKIQPQFNMHKAAVYAVVINAMQILAMAGLAVYVLTDRMNMALQGALGDILVLMLAVVVIWGAVVDIREAMAAGHMTLKLDGLDKTVSQMTDLNIALRSQRHDFLNHLQVVYSLMEMGEYQEANRYIEQVYGDIQALSQQMKTACAPVNALLRAKAAEAQKRGVRVEQNIQAAWRELPVPAWELCRVLGNLIDNAMDALEGRKGARLKIALSEDVRSISFAISNNGPAIPKSTQGAIFEAGVSGKGEGRGMGLYISRNTMRAAGGDLTVESDDKRTVFSGFLPKKITSSVD